MSTNINARWPTVLLLTLAVALLPGCLATDGGQKQTIGTIGGAVAGGLLGTQVGSGSGRIVAAVAGTALGAYLGSELGKYLDERDRVKQAEATQGALEQEAANNVSWDNPDTGVSGEVEAGPIRYETQYKADRGAEKVRSSPQMIVLGEDYRTLRSSNVRAEPATDSAVVASLHDGEVFHAVGKVSDRNWILASRQGRTIGYVYGDLVEPLGPPEEMVAAGPAPDSADSAAQAHPRTAVPVDRRTVTRKITLADGNVKKEKVDFCRPQGGEWERCVT